MSDFEKTYAIKVRTTSAIRSVNKLETAVKKLNSRIGVARSHFAALGGTLRKLEKGFEKVGKESQTAGIKLKRYLGPSASGHVGKLNEKLLRTRVNLARIRGGLDKIARKLAVASAAFAAFGGLGVRNALELNKAMANVSTLLSGGTEQIVGLKTAVQDMAKDTGKSTDDLAAGLYDVVSALGESTENVEQLGIASRASVAGLSTTKEAIGLLTATTKGYGDTSSAAMQKVSDLAFQTVKLGVTTFPELAASMGRVIPLAAAMKTSQEELFGTMATLTGVTGNASEVSTQLASVYSAFLKPTEAMTTAVKKAGYESASAMMKEIGLRNSLLELNKAVDGNEDKLARMLKRKEALVGALALLGGQSDTWTYKLGEMEKAIGSTDAAYRKQTEGINEQGHSWEKTKQRMVVFTQRLGDKLLPVLSRLLTKLEPVIEYIENMSEETIESWIQLGKWTAILAVAAKSLSGLLGVVETIGALKSLNLGIAGVSQGLAAVPGQAAAAKASIAGMTGGFLAAAAAGAALGTALNDIFFAPHSKGRAKALDSMIDSTDKAERIAKHGTPEEIKNALAQINQTRQGYMTGNQSTEEIAGTFIDPEGLGARRGKGRARSEHATRILEKALIKQQDEAELRSLGSERGGGGFEGMYDIVPTGGKPGGMNITTGPTTFNITGVPNPEKVGRIVDRKMKRRDRQHQAEIRRAARGEGAAEQ